MNANQTEHAWCREQLAANVAGGLDEAERKRFDAHVAGCAECAAELKAMQQEDQAMQAAFAGVPDVGFEQRIIAGLRHRWTPRRLAIHPMVTKAAAGVAAVLVLGAIGAAANRMLEGGSLPTLSFSGAKIAFSSGRPPVLPATAEQLVAVTDPTIREQLDMRLPEVKIEGQPLDDVVQFLRDMTGTNIYVNWGALEAAKVKRKAPVALTLRDVKLKTVLDYILDQVGSEPQQKLAYAANDGVLRISTVADTMDTAGKWSTPASAMAIGGESFLGARAEPLDERTRFVEAEQPRNRKMDEAQVAYGDIYRYPERSLDISSTRARPPVETSLQFFARPVADAKYGQAKPTPVPTPESFKLPTMTVALLGDTDRKPEHGTGPIRGFVLGRPVDGNDLALSSFNGQVDMDADKGKKVSLDVPVQLAQTPAQPAPVAAPTAQPAAAAPTPPAASTQAPDIAASRKIIRTGQMDFEVESFDSAFTRIGAIVKEEGGFVASTDSQKLPNGKMTGTVTLRVAPEHLDTLVLKLRGLGDLKSQKIVAQDVTKQYTDLESELRAARAMEQRLLDIIKTGKGEIKDLVAAEKELGVWREKIEKVEGEIRYYASQIALSTLTVSLAEKDVKAAASVSETELRSIGIETEDVEKAYAAAQDLVGEYKGHVVSANLKKLEAGQFAADLVCDIAPVDTGPMTDRLKQLGTVARLESDRKRTTADGSEPPATAKVERKDTRFVISLYNLANIAPRQTLNVNLACRNVEDAYRAILTRVAKAGGRVVGSNLNQQKADQTTASINFQVKNDDADAMLQALRQPSEGNDTEVVRLTAAENPDTKNVTTAKRGFAVQIVSLASIAPRETIKLQLAAASVPDAYKVLTGVLGGDSVQARVLSSQLSELDRRDINGTLDFELRRADLPELDKALKAAGDVVSRNAVRALDAENTIDSKVRVTMGLVSADRLPPRELFTMAIESANVEKAIGDLSATTAGIGGRSFDSHITRSADGRVSGRLMLDVPLNKAVEIVQAVRSQGTVRSVESEKNSQVPDGSLARARLDVSISNGEAIVSADKGLYASVRNALATSVAGLLWSLQLIVIGLFLVGPWLLVLWGGVKLVRRIRRPTSAVRSS